MSKTKKNTKKAPSAKALKAAKHFGDMCLPETRKGAGGAVGPPCWRQFFAGKEEEFYESLAEYLEKYALAETEEWRQHAERRLNILADIHDMTELV